MKCWFCSYDLMWQCDYSYEEYGLEGDGMVAVLYCPYCDATWEGYCPSEDNQIQEV